MGVITKIKIENVKGYGVPGTELDVHIDPKKINICIAPNGFGKSSLTAAFKSLNRNKLNVADEDKNERHRTEDSSLELTINNHTYVANGKGNEISKDAKITPYVINCRIKADYNQNRYNNYTNVSSYLSIPDIEVRPVISKPKFEYSISEIRKEFGKNGKILKKNN